LEISGEAGIGKSRLKYELRQLIKEKDISFYQGYSPAYEIQIPYYPFSLILKEVLKLSLEGSEEKQKKALADAVKNLGEDLMDTVPYLGAVLSLVYPEVVALDDVSRQERIFSAMLRIFERLSRHKPLVLVFEDLQWIDSLSRSLLTYLIEHSQDLPMLFCCLYRPEFEPSWKRSDRVLLELRAIEKEEEIRLIGSLLGELSLPGNLVDLILSKSEGNPFYLEEMLRSLMDSGILVKGRRGFELKGEIGEIDIPDTIQGVIMSRLDRLERRAKETLQYASVIGREFPQRLLEEISERGGEVEEQLSLLQRLELVFQKQLMPELEYIFKHFLTQSVAYNSILLKKRRELHLKIAKSIEKLYKDRLEEYYELLGHHYERAESWLKATEYFGKAGKKSSELHSKEVTTEHRKREEAAYGRLIFQFALVAILVVVGLTISSFLEVGIPLPKEGMSEIVPLRMVEASERLILLSRVPRIFIIGIVTLILISGFFMVFRLIAKAFCPPWISTKIYWRHPFRFASEESISTKPQIRILAIFLQLIPGIVLSFLGALSPGFLDEKMGFFLLAMSLISPMGIWLIGKLGRYKGRYISTLLGSLIGTIILLTVFVVSQGDPPVLVSQRYPPVFLFLFLLLPSCTGVFFFHYLRFNWKEIISTIIMFAITLLSLTIMFAITRMFNIALMSTDIMFANAPILSSLPWFFLNLIAMVSGSLFWLVFSRVGILRTPMKIQIPPLGQAVWIGLHGALAGGLIYNTFKLGFWAAKEFSQFFGNFGWLSLEFSLFLEFIAGVIFITSWVGLVIGTVLFALARPDISLKKRLKASSYGWIIGLVGVVIGLMFYYLVMVGKYDYGRDLAQAIGIPKAASSNKTIIFFKENKQSEVIREPLSDIVYPLEEKSYTLDASEESIQKAMDYLQKRNYIETSLLPECRHYIWNSLGLNWDFDSRLEWSYRVAKSGVPTGVFYGCNYFMIYITRSVAKSPKNLKLLEDIAKDKRFYISPRACQMLGGFYWSYARREDALYWYKKAGLSQPEVQVAYLNKLCEEISSKPLLFVEGRIEGKILINDKAVSGIKARLAIPRGDIDVSAVITPSASTKTDSGGVFHFENIVEGEYSFALMADEKLIPADANKIKVINAPGKIIIDAQNPSVDLGEINIITQVAIDQN
jgi:hypothetical protein